MGKTISGTGEKNMARGGLSFRRKKRLSSEVKALIRNYVAGCLTAVILGILFVVGFGYTITNVGVSMEDAIVHNQKILVNRTSYFFFSPKAGDVIVFKHGNNEHMYIKRVVAVPGDTVQIIDGQLYVNSVLVKGDFDKIADPGIAEEKLYLGEDEYFVMGDNRNNSEDSRFQSIGAISKNQIIGKAWFALPAEGSNMKPIS